MKTSELTGAALDHAVAQAAKERVVIGFREVLYTPPGKRTLYRYTPSTNWKQGGPIIEREGLTLTHQGERWGAETDEGTFAYGPTPLIAAMRCFVASHLGDTVELPGDLT